MIKAITSLSDVRWANLSVTFSADISRNPRFSGLYSRNFGQKLELLR